ncbi:hypothetical protein BDP27DRAFT_1406455 [Rhodocollybia butyracea]|uniref:Phosphoglycerate mutase-like protein n=1 Tax=Rhodocollybia butyracea TaxID=206335 RepID=A0A9P5PEM8_9AGAR|nr:hypothetical protein BDP27DRAFT_1406455 [Rhodocollybia butyracea]
MADADKHYHTTPPILVPNNQNRTTTKPQWKCLFLSLIRHAQARANTRTDSPLTPLGHAQADDLAAEWQRVRIDKLVSSHLQPRSKQPQRSPQPIPSISEDSDSEEPVEDPRDAEWAEHPLSVSVDYHVQERKCGFLVPKLSAQHQTIAAYHALYGTTVPGRIARDHTPPQGGESLDTVADRAKAFVLSIMKEHGQHVWGFGPEDFNLERWNRSDLIEAERVPNPHVAVVSHSVFLEELYEMMYFWDKGERPKKALGCHWGNAEWTRHVLWIREKEDSSYEFQFRDIRAPRTADGSALPPYISTSIGREKGLKINGSGNVDENISSFGTSVLYV